MQDFRELKVWQRSHELSLVVYRATSGFPDAERFGLTSQMRRAAASIGANIAEGSGRGSNPDFLRFLHNAMGSACELENFVLLARDLDILAPSTARELEAAVQQLKRMLATFIARVRGLKTDN